MKIAQEIGNRFGEGTLTVGLTNHWVTIKKPLSIMKNGKLHKIGDRHKKSVIVTIRVSEGTEKEKPMEVSVVLTPHWVTRKAIEYEKKFFKIAHEISVRTGKSL